MGAEETLFQRFGKELSKGTVLFREGDPGKEMYVLQSGKVAISRRVRDVEKVLATLGPGEFFGEMALLDQGPRTATVKPATPMSLYVIGAREFASLTEEFPHVTRKLLQGLTRRLRHLENAPKSEWSRL